MVSIFYQPVMNINCDLVV